MRCWLLRKGGTKFWRLLTVSAVEDESGHLRGFSMLARDVSERKRTEQRLHFLDSLTTATASLQGADEILAA